MIANLKNFNFGFVQTLVKKNKVYYQCKRGFSKQACKNAKVITNLKNFNLGFVLTLVRKIKYIISIREGSAGRLVRMQK